jgi:sugar/nucleoside kinase (ribokinase family)
MLEQAFLIINEWMSGGLLVAAVGCFLWGMVSVAFSPCHIASIPLIVGYVAGQERALKARDAACYAGVFSIGLFIDAALAAASEARRSGVAVIVDAGTLRDGMLELARLSDCFVASESFTHSLVGAEDPLEACRRILELGPGIAGVTLGARGYAARFGGRSIVKPAYEVESVDTTGCGDVFHAGLAYGILHGWHPERSFDLAAWAAAQVARKMGGRSGIPSKQDLLGRAVE